MFAGLLLVVPLFLLLAGGVVVMVVLALTHRPDADLTAEVVSARRHGVVTSGVATAMLVLGPLLVWVATSSLLALGPLLGVLPLAGAATALLVLLVGELTWPRPRGTTRTAVVRDRSAADLLRGGWARVAAAAGAALVVAVVLAAWLADESGRGVAADRTDATGAVVSSGAGPFPGLDYGLPQLVVLTLVAGLVLLVVRAATNRPAVVAADAATDQLLRRSSAARAFRVALVGTLLTLAADLFFGGMAAQHVFTGPARIAAVATVLVGLVCGLAALAALLWPVPRLRAVAAEPPAPAHA